MTVPKLAVEIEHKLWAEPLESFPYNEIRKLRRGNCPTESIVPDLDIFVSAIEGYACSARALSVANRQKIVKVKKDVARSFFEVFPQYELCRKAINETDTPKLHHLLALTEELRLDLQKLITDLLHQKKTKYGKRQNVP